ncbi:hypothetical protein [Burkholderia cenocepacia]|uniref:hypothetical protein n=1 Tax=Burkholderia cenocepacia TaxID=95486 RepID=UPI00076D9EAE|nr:hypothetical protein [Burkholderia cenocepacia]KWU23391.1 hypothetical protein AS149_37005 [Burkholderia cenocepacia]
MTIATLAFAPIAGVSRQQFHQQWAMLAHMKLLTPELLACRALLLGKPLVASFVRGRDSRRPYVALVTALRGLKSNAAAKYFAAKAGVNFEALVARASFEAELLKVAWPAGSRQRRNATFKSVDLGEQYELEYHITASEVEGGSIARRASFDTLDAAVAARLRIKTVASSPAALTQSEQAELMTAYSTPGAAFVDQWPRLFKVQTRELVDVAE